MKQLMQQNLTVIAAPLIIMALLASGYVLIYLKDVLVPFLLALFLVYLLRPLVWLLDVPFNCCCRSTCRVWRFATCSVKKRKNSGAAADGGTPSGVEMERVHLPDDAHVLRVPSSRRPFYSPVPKGRKKGRAETSRRRKERARSMSFEESVRRRGSSDAQSDQCPHWVASIVALMVAGGFAGCVLFWLVMTLISIDSDIYGKVKDEWRVLSNVTEFWFGVKLDVDKNTVLRTIHEELPVGQIVHKVLFTIVERFGDVFFVLLGTVYMMLDSAGRRTKASPLRANIERQIQRYLGLKSFVSAMNGVGVYLVLGPLLHIPAAFGIGILVSEKRNVVSRFVVFCARERRTNAGYAHTSPRPVSLPPPPPILSLSLSLIQTFFLNFIPSIGAVVAILLPLPVILLTPMGSLDVMRIVLAFALPSLIHGFIGTVLEPCLFGHDLEIHPVVIMLALAIWYSLWGMVGALFAVPITAVCKIILQQLEHPYAEVFLDLLDLRLPRILDATSTSSKRYSEGGGLSPRTEDDEDDDHDDGNNIAGEDGDEEILVDRERWRADAARTGGGDGGDASSSSSGSGGASSTRKVSASPLLDLSSVPPVRARGRTTREE